MMSTEFARHHDARQLNPSCSGLTNDQQDALNRLTLFLQSDAHGFLLSGAAGTGKTFLLRHAIERARTAGYIVRLLTPTGRAARVAGRSAKVEASTIHRHIFQYAGMEVAGETDDETKISLRYTLRPNNEPPRMVYIVDEASMVPDRSSEKDAESSHLQFGSGRLLSDLIQYAGLHIPGCKRKLIFIGDDAQLPPVTDAVSPALSATYLEQHFGLLVISAELTEVVRQQADSGILEQASSIRESIDARRFNVLNIKPNHDVQLATDAVSAFAAAAREDTLKNTILITRTNREATELNEGVRNVRFGTVPDVRRGDRLIIVHNNYAHSLLNGDFVEVLSASDDVEIRTPLRGTRLVFRDVTVRLEDDRAQVVTCKLLDDFLSSTDGGLTPELLQALVVDFVQRHKHLKPNTSAFEQALLEDPYFNAVRAKYGYAVTCHKAQGGEWRTAVVCFDGRPTGWDNEHYFRWTYTAITRASETMFVVNAPRHAPATGLNVVMPPAEAAPSVSLDVPDVEAVLRKHGAAITNRQDLPYRLRIRFEHDGLHAHLDIVYNGKNIVTGIDTSAAGRIVQDPDSLRDELRPLIGTRLDEGERAPVTFPDDQPHLEEFYTAIRRKLEGTDIEIANVVHMQWMERYTFVQRRERVEVDFYYNARGRFRSVNVHGAGALAQRIRSLIESE